MLDETFHHGAQVSRRVRPIANRISRKRLAIKINATTENRNSADDCAVPTGTPTAT
jgi:hypothetical protein